MRNEILSTIRSNRRALRQRGLTAADLLTLEALAVKAPEGLRRVSIAALGRMTGVSRMTALRHVRRLEAVGAVVRVGCALGLNVRGLLSWAAEAATARLERAKALFLLRKAKAVTHSATQRSVKSLEEGRGSPCDAIPERHEALRELAKIDWAAIWARRAEREARQ